MGDQSNALALDIHDVFRRNGAQCTPQREAVWEFFASHLQGHTIGDAVAALQGRHIGQATVYRTVFLLQDLGVLRRVQDPDGKALFIAVRPGHSHPLICRKCHATVEFKACTFPILEELLTAKTGYEVHGHDLVVFGICPECQAAREE